MAHYLVTGGCGFIGSHLADLLLAGGHTVRVLDDLSTGKRENLSPQAELVIGDVADPEKVAQAMAGVDGCFHLAAVASVDRCNRDWLGTHRTNLTGTITIFDCARATAARPAIPVVYASSAAIYGDQPQVPQDERMGPQPLSSYGADKLGCELHARVALALAAPLDAALGRDATKVFNYLSGYVQPEGLENLAISPITLKSTLLERIAAEADHARAGRPAEIWAKMNSLVDGQVIGMPARRPTKAKSREEKCETAMMHIPDAHTEAPCSIVLPPRLTTYLAKQSPLLSYQSQRALACFICGDD